MRFSAARHVVRHVLPLITFLAAAGASSARAQDRVFVGGNAPTAEAGALGHFGDNLGRRPDWALGPFIAGGRYAVESRGSTDLNGGGTAPIVREVRTGASVPLPVGWLTAVDPLRARVFLLLGTASAPEIVSANLDTGSTTVLALAPMFLHVPPVGFLYPALPEIQFAQNVGQLFVRRGATAGGPPELVVIDAATGVLIRTLPDTATRANGLSSLDGDHWLVHPDGTRLVMHHDLRVDVHDAATGAHLAGTPVSTAPLGYTLPPGTALAADWSNGRVLAFQGQPNNWMLSLVSASGQLVGETLKRGYCRPALRVSPHTGRGYLLYNTGGGGSYYGAILTALAAFDAATLRVTDVRDVTEEFGFGTDRCGALTLSVATAPGAPRALAATVSGRDVTLAWSNIGDATSFVLDVGVAPGRTDLSFSLGATAPISIANAPPGTYYLRVRGANAFGVSRPSNEIVTVVP